MTANNFNFSLVLRADVAAAKSALAEVTTGMRQMSTEAAAAGSATTSHAGDLERMAAAATKAMVAQDGLVTAEKRAAEARTRALVAPVADPTGSTSSLMAVYKSTETSAEALRQSVSGLSVSIGTQAQDMLEGAAASRAWQAALDDVRASFNPLFAASRQYEAQLERITEAERLGAISAREAASARAAAAGRISPTVNGADRSSVANNFNSANIGAQGFDIGVTAAMGMNPLTIGLQQGSQLVGVMQQMGGGAAAAKGIATGLLSIISPASLATIALVSLSAAGIQGLMKLKGETKTFDQNVDALTATLGRMKASLDVVQNTRLGDTFGGMKDDVRALAQGMLELDRASELKQLKSVMDTFLDKEVDEGWGQRIWGGIGMGATPIPGMTTDDYLKNTAARKKNYAALGAANTYDDFQRRIEEMQKLTDSGDVDGVTEKFLALQDAMTGGGSVTGMKDELRALLSEISKNAIESAKLEAIWNGSAKAEVIKRQTDQMIMAYKQQSDLAGAEVQFGKESAQVEALRAQQARDVLAVRLDEQGIVKDSANWQRIMQALSEQELATAKQVADEKRKQVEAIALGYRQEAELATAARQFGQDGLAVERIRARQASDALDLRLEEMGVIKDSVAWQEAHNALLEQQQQREQDILDAKKEAVRDQLDLLAGLRRETALIGASNAERLRANALAEAEVDIRKRKLGWLEAELERVRAISRANAEAERDRQQALSDIQTQGQMAAFDGRIAQERNPAIRAAIEAEKEYASQIASGADATVAAAAAEQVRAQAMSELHQSQAEFLRGQQDSLAQQRLELALIGQTAEVRARVLALTQAERDIQRLGATGSMAEQMRQNAAAKAELDLVIEAQADAWGRVQSAGESAIDSVLDKLRDGDISGAMTDFIGEIEKGFFDLAVRNPLKNALFGTNLGTMQDADGLSGIFARLSGKSSVDETALVSQATMPVASMSVNAANVMIGGVGLQSFLAQGANGTGMIGSGGAGFGGLAGSGNVQSQVWSFFQGKGMQPHQIAAIMGNVSAESAFNPMAVGDGGTSFGLFQHHAGRGQNLLNAVGGQAGLGNVSAQLEHVWQELLTGENGVLKRLMASTNVKDATAAFVGFERPQGWSQANPFGAHNFDGRLGAAEEALTKFGTTAATTTLDLGTLGSGFDIFGNALASGLNGLTNGGTQGGLSGLLTALAGGIAGSLGIPGFAEGGHTGGSSPDEIRGVVHGKEYVFDAAATARIGVANLDNLRKGAVKGYNQGGYVSSSPILTSLPMSAANSPMPVVQLQPVLVNNTDRQMHMEVEETTDPRGQRQQRYVLSDIVADGMAAPGGKARRTMKQVYGIDRSARQRS